MERGRLEPLMRIWGSRRGSHWGWQAALEPYISVEWGLATLTLLKGSGEPSRPRRKDPRCSGCYPESKLQACNCDS